MPDIHPDQGRDPADRVEARTINAGVPAEEEKVAPASPRIAAAQVVEPELPQQVDPPQQEALPQPIENAANQQDAGQAEDQIDFAAFDLLDVGEEGPVHGEERDQWARQRELAKKASMSRSYKPIVSRQVFDVAGSMHKMLI